MQTIKNMINSVQEKLAESIDLKLQIKHAHWNVKGPQFIALHKLFDEIAIECEEYSDLIAERIVQLGGVAEGTLPSVAKHSRLPEFPLNSITGVQHAEALVHALASYGKYTRKAIDIANEVNDAVTADIFTEISRSVEKNLWLVQAHLNSET